MIYALTLGCIIFLCVSLNLLLNTINDSSVEMPGTDVYVKSYERDMMNATTVDPVLRQYQDDIKDFGWITDSTWSMYDRKNQTREMMFSDIGR